MTPDSRKSRSAWSGALKSFALGFCVFSLGGILATWLTLKNVHGLLAFTDNVLTGIAAGLLVLLYERWRQHEAEKKLQTIRLMNHHVRNALQVIYATSDNLDEAKQRSVQEAVGRIEWALREVLPGETELANDLFPASPDKTKKASVFSRF